MHECPECHREFAFMKKLRDHMFRAHRKWLSPQQQIAVLKKHQPVS